MSNVPPPPYGEQPPQQPPAGPPPGGGTPPPGGPPPGYGQTPPPAYGQPVYGGGGGGGGGMNPLAIASLVTGILSILCCFGFFAFGVVLGGAGLVLGYLAKQQIAESGGTQQGDPLALAGMITGGIGVVLGIISFILFIAT
jgi:hypothetical protein